MANGPTLPPQAYTREVLAVAFQWLQGQPESIKKLAQSPDALVGLYLRAQRYGNASPEADAPVSSQNFISDLKNLAEGLKQFEDSKNASRPDMRSMTATRSFTTTQSSSNKMQGMGSGMNTSMDEQSWNQPRSFGQMIRPPEPPPVPTQMAPQVSTQINAGQINAGQMSASLQQSLQQSLQHSIHQSYQHQSMPPAVPPQSMAPVAQHADLASHLNPTAQAMIQEVKGHLNLTSDAEVLNMLVSIAYKNIRNLLS